MDSYLAEVTSDTNLKLTKLCELALVLSDHARIYDDSVYRGRRGGRHRWWEVERGPTVGGGAAVIKRERKLRLRKRGIRERWMRMKRKGRKEGKCLFA